MKNGALLNFFKSGFKNLTVLGKGGSTNTAYTDTFDLLRKGSQKLFWNAVNATDFENEAKRALLKSLSENSTGNVNSLTSRRNTQRKSKWSYL